MYQGQEDREYNWYNDSLDRRLQIENISQQREAQKREDAQRLVDSILSAGGTPSADLLAESGYPSEYADALAQDYRRQMMEQDQALIQKQINDIFKVGGVPSQELIDMSGLSPDYIKIMSAYSRQQSAPSSGGSRRSSGSSGSRGGSSASNSSGDNYDGLFAAAKASGHPASYIANHYKEYGFKSSSGLAKEYEQWAEEMEDGGIPENAGVSNYRYGNTGSDRQYIQIDGTLAVPVDQLEDYIERGLVAERYDPATNKVTYVRAGR